MEELVVREAGADGLQSLEHLIGLLSTHHHRKPSYPTTTNTVDYTAVADVNQISILKKSTIIPVPSPENIPATAPSMVVPEKVFALASIQQRVVKSGSFERKDVPTATTINFAGAAAIASPETSFMSSLTGDTDGLQPSMSSGFQITNMSQVSSVGQPDASTSSFKRKCNSANDSHTKCTNSSGPRHCTKKRKSRMQRVGRIPAISSKTGGYTTG
uniref:Probable WRKY transcription factor 7 n=1 Tax=Tanacetum cinerariifolium TaxID=118510 RepID=A0A6L2J6J8_TANCI|nr:probable WRKY transcription factor 7 [Tanacetum cinerariifolium]